ncbi:Conjugative transfer protein TrbI [Rhodovulum sp. PH10]|uniref:TrbI/VirB10 family protein n=1 Tax=Rhodovulum sp. PH10 TaxID=1187851 RepID=UPI00027C1F27|nr:TrbI/VirB10 family protein [Rhodovulum sp. PH10]EJW09565.1 Conjugative transfer protein TrbI [Rhodovulum sp. PH10]
MRLSRKVLVGLLAGVSIVVSGALIWGFSREKPKPASGGELYSTEHKPLPDAIAALPRDYAAVAKPAGATVPAGVPKLGPPLPGDLGRPMLSAGVTPAEPSHAPDPAQQRSAQEQEAARTSKLFAPATTATRPTATVTPVLPSADDVVTAPAVRSDPQPLDADWGQNLQDRKLAFLNAAVDRRTVSPDRLAAPPSRYVVQAGAVIAAALVTGIRSALPGQVTAQVTEHVYDSPTGRYLLVPQGSKLIGVYDSQVAFGQDRILLVWTRLILPNGRSIVLERQPAADPQGFAGLEDEVDHHWGRLFMAAALSTLLGVGSELGTSDSEGELLRAVRRGGSTSLNQTGQQVVRRNLNIQPTLTIRPGFPVRVIVNRDLVLAPYRG